MFISPSPNGKLLVIALTALVPASNLIYIYYN